MAKVKLIMTAILEIEVDPSAVYDLSEYSENEQPTIEDTIKDVIEGYLDRPQDFVKDDNTSVEITYEIVE